jgi:hypothetical protein
VDTSGVRKAVNQDNSKVLGASVETVAIYVSVSARSLWSGYLDNHLLAIKARVIWRVQRIIVGEKL